MSAGADSQNEIGGIRYRYSALRSGSRPMPVNLQEILLAFEFVDSASGLHEAYLCRLTGKIYFHAEFTDFEEFNDELPDDIEDDEKYVAVPGKRELGLGKPLVLDFAREFLPDDFDEVRYIFSKRGAYKKFRALVIRRNVLEQWYDFESKTTERAVREWCEFNSIELADDPPTGLQGSAQ
jgi:hypothetical protein